jgi:hypothetical protein
VVQVFRPFAPSHRLRRTVARWIGLKLGGCARGRCYGCVCILYGHTSMYGSLSHSVWRLCTDTCVLRFAQCQLKTEDWFGCVCASLARDLGSQTC